MINIIIISRGTGNNNDDDDDTKYQIQSSNSNSSKTVTNNNFIYKIRCLFKTYDNMLSRAFYEYLLAEASKKKSLYTQHKPETFSHTHFFFASSACT